MEKKKQKKKQVLMIIVVATLLAGYIVSALTGNWWLFMVFGLASVAMGMKGIFSKRRK
jgi:uncharacterized membrane protein